MMKTLIFFCCCFLIQNTFAQTPQWVWAKGGTNIGKAQGLSVSTDNAGNIYTTGYYENTISFGTTSLTSAGDKDVFITKHNSSGNLIWAKSVGGNGYDAGSGIVTDTIGNIYIAGVFSDTVNIGNDTLISAGSTDIFLAKYDSIGNLIWVKTGGGKDPDIIANTVGGISLDNIGNVLITGTFAMNPISPPAYDTATFGNVNLISLGGSDIFLAKYSPFGNLMWAKSAGGTFSDVGVNIQADKNGNIYMSGGYTSSSIHFGNIQLSSISQGFVIGSEFLAKYDSSGNPIWAKTIGGIHQGGPSDGNSLGPAYLSIDQNGYLYLLGSYFQCRIIFENGYTLNPIGNNDMFIAKFDNYGNLIWAKSIGGFGADDAGGISFDNQNSQVYISGSFNATAIFGNDTLTSSDGQDVFVAKFDTSGNDQWVIKAEGNGLGQGVSVTTSNDGSIYTTGYYTSNPLIFGNDSLTNGGSYDVFIAELSTTTGIPMLSNAGDELTLYPNPSSGILHVKNDKENLTSFKVIDQLGRLVKEQKLQSHQTDIDVHQLPDGMYYLQLKGKGLPVTKKIIIQH